MLIHNVKFVRILSTASIVLVFLTVESFARHIRSPDEDQSNQDEWDQEQSDQEEWDQDQSDEEHFPILTKSYWCGGAHERKKVINGNETICECVDGSYRYKNLSDCYQPNILGPCGLGGVLFLPENKTELECVQNHCGDEELFYNGASYIWEKENCRRGQISYFSYESLEALCRCDNGLAYYPQTDECYKPYTRGPCEDGQYLDLSENETTLECVENPCGDNGYFKNGSCYIVDGARGPCGPGQYVKTSKSEESTCECNFMHYLHPKTDDCYIPYTQGPCEKGQYLVVSENKMEVECVEDPCGNGKVPYEGSCYSLDDDLGPCGPHADFKISTESHKPFCQCDEIYLHYHKTKRCYQPYHQGPCEKGKYLVLPENKTELECSENPCGDNEVPYQGSCYSWDGSNQPHCPENTSFGISIDSYKPACNGPLISVMSLVVFPRTACAKGCRRDGSGSRCLPEYDKSESKNGKLWYKNPISHWDTKNCSPKK